MSRRLPRLDVGDWDGDIVRPGDRRDLEIVISESYSGNEIHLPVHVARAEKPGPTGFVVAAIHGDEINGTGIVRQLVLEEELKLTAGAMILVPVVNMPAFDRHSRYLPDRRDLNRAFPGSPDGSMARRLAHLVFQQIVGRCDFGVDLHSAAVRRTNVPNVRGDLDHPEVLRMTEAFGCELIVHSKGPDNSFRREATLAGCPTILLEAGEVWKVEQTVVETAVRGIRNLLIELGMAEGEPVLPTYQVKSRKTKWVRAEHGGFLHFHVRPGELVEKGQALATNSSLLGRVQNVLPSPANGIILGMTTLPAVSPGDPICHLALLDQPMRKIERAIDRLPEESLHERLRADLSSSLLVDEPAGSAEPE